MHFYCKTDNGIEPRHFTKMKSRPDELRPSRISDMKKAAKEGEVWAPSVTTVLNILSKPGLESWKVDQYLEQALEIAKANIESVRLDSSFPDFDRDWFFSTVKSRTEHFMEIAPKAGTDIHKSLEMYFADKLPFDSPDFFLCEEVYDEVKRRTEVMGWITEQNFICDLGYGGQVDLHNEDWVIDFKSKQTKDKFKPGKMVYQEHSCQLAAYREGLGIPQARCGNVFVCLETGEVDFHEHSPEQLETGWMMFYHALRLWQVMNGAPQ